MATPSMLSSNSLASSSSPARDKPLFSSDAPPQPSSPPSSPPGFPWEYEQQPTSKSSHATPKSPTQPPKNAFSMLGRGKRKALTPVSDNARPTKRRASKPDETKSKSLMQMQINLGQEVQKTCQQCGMEYTVSSPEDRKLHDKYHKQNTEGYDVGKDFVQKARDGTVFKGVNDGDSICMIDREEKPARKKRAQSALDIVQRELGAVPISEKELCSVQKYDASKARFRVYMYIRGTKCIGVLLVEGMNGREAYKVVEPIDSRLKTAEAEKTLQTSATEALKARREAKKALQNRPITISDIIETAKLGISRIWTSPTHRGQRIATRLLDVALEHHNQCVAEWKIAAEKAVADASKEGGEKKRKEVDAVKSLELEEVGKIKDKMQVAFSHPTEMGTKLARKWFGKLYGWSVYVD